MWVCRLKVAERDTDEKMLGLAVGVGLAAEAPKVALVAGRPSHDPGGVQRRDAAAGEVAPAEQGRTGGGKLPVSSTPDF